MFKISARTVLELGSELISSDLIAFYELVKNAFDAGSPSGAEIRFEIVMRRNQYLKFRQQALANSADVRKIKTDIVRAIEPSAPNDAMSRFLKTIEAATTPERLVRRLDRAYETENRIIVSDEGTGMSAGDLIDNFLVIGTASRKRAVNAALESRNGSNGKSPFLGEKGIGRLSAMRLGDTLTVETARKSNKLINILKIDWTAFRDLDAMLEDIKVAPKSGELKPRRDWSGTRIIIGSLSADWTNDRVKKLASLEFSRLTDPFAQSKQRPRIAIFWNGHRIPISRLDHNLLDNAHASIKGRFHYGERGPVLEYEVEAIDLGFEHPNEIEKIQIPSVDLEGLITGTSTDIPFSALNDLGGFEFEFYWFNRRRLGKIDSIGERADVVELQRRWSGILLFRDGFRILPYGNNDDDWLALDRTALGAQRYLLNKLQFVGRVNISRLGNPDLIDQTNREGLHFGPAQQAFIGLLQVIIQEKLRRFIVDIQKRYKDQPVSLAEMKTDVPALEKRTIDALKRIRRMVPEESEILDELQNNFFEIKDFLDKAQRRISEVENENRQMVQMAGVGLLVEVVAHELARSTESALAALEALRKTDVPAPLSALLESLRAEMISVSKRVRVLDPLSVSGRQRREIFDFGDLINDVLSGHEAQFARHHVRLNWGIPSEPIRVRAVKGMVIQILENLLSNSLYWLDLRSQNESAFRPSISINIQTNPLIMTLEDNGRGVALENREKVFRPFFSLKEKSKRRGLGLFIGRECAEYHKGYLTLDETINQETGRLHRFVFELPDEVIIS